MTQHIRFVEADGTAALGICEALLLALTDLKIISEKDARDLLEDVAATHQEAANGAQTPEKHQAVVRDRPPVSALRTWGGRYSAAFVRTSVAQRATADATCFTCSRTSLAGAAIA